MWFGTKRSRVGSKPARGMLFLPRRARRCWMARSFVVFALVLGIGLSTVVPAGSGGSPGPGGATAYAAPDPDPRFPSKNDVDQAKQNAAAAAGEAGRIEAQLAAANAELRRLDGQFQ